MYRCGWLAVCVLAFALPAMARTWTDNEGHSVEGEFVRVVKVKVVINVSGRMIQVPFGHLVQDDQDFVREQLEAHGLGGQLPAKKKTATSDSATGAKSAEKENAAANEPKPGPERTWTDILGRSIQARFIGMDDAKVVLQIKGKHTSFPFDKFSITDQRYVRTEMTGRGEGDKVPAEAAPANVQPGPVGPQFVQAQPPAMPTQPPAPAQATPIFAPPTPSFSHTPTPTFTPPAPYIPPSLPSYQPNTQVRAKVCMKCGKIVPDNLTAGDHCPYCGVLFDFDATTGKRASWSAYAAGEVAGTGTLIALGIAVLARFLKRL